MAGNSGRLEGKVAVITGAADGIGHAIARAMATEGAHVFVGDIDDAKGEAAAAALRAEGSKADFRHCDVSVEADIAARSGGARSTSEIGDAIAARLRA